MPSDVLEHTSIVVCNIEFLAITGNPHPRRTLTNLGSPLITAIWRPVFPLLSLSSLLLLVPNAVAGYYTTTTPDYYSSTYVPSPTTYEYTPYILPSTYDSTSSYEYSTSLYSYPTIATTYYSSTYDYSTSQYSYPTISSSYYMTTYYSTYQQSSTIYSSAYATETVFAESQLLSDGSTSGVAVPWYATTAGKWGLGMCCGGISACVLGLVTWCLKKRRRQALKGAYSKISGKKSKYEPFAHGPDCQCGQHQTSYGGHQGQRQPFMQGHQHPMPVAWQQDSGLWHGNA